jgi:diguanylate cyclase (GGDEF)-like protein/PAS domain S-box-containing protein
MTTPLPDFERISSYSTDTYLRFLFHEGLTYISPGFSSMTGYPTDEVLGSRDFFERVVDPQDLDMLNKHLERMRTKEIAQETIHLRWLHRDGHSIPVQLFCVSVHDSSQGVIGVDCCTRDVHEHREITDLLTRRNQEHEILLHLQRTLLSQHDMQLTLDTIVDKAHKLFNARGCTLFLLDQEHGAIRPVAASGEYATEMMALQLDIGEGLIGWVIQHGVPSRVDHALEDPRVVQVNHTSEVDESLLCAPLVITDQVAGALLLSGEPGQYSDDDLRFLTALAQVASLAVANSRLFTQVERLATVDDLTSAYNRNFFNNRLDDELRRASRIGYSVGLLIVDVDDLKAVNDRYTHTVGDELLKAVVNVLRENIRGTDWVARFGGDEFAVVLSGCPPHELQNVADKLLVAMRTAEFSLPGSGEKGIKVSIGGATYPDLVESSEDLIFVADQSEREAKRAGGDRVRISVEE